ncbi:hypothetical protein ACFX2B_012690 [Malus domestica]
MLRVRQIGKNAQPLITFEKTFPTRLLAQKLKRHRFPNLENQTSTRMTFSKIKEALLFDSREPDSQPDYLHDFPNLESQTPNRIAFSKIEEAPLFKSQEPDSQQDCFLKNRRGIVIRISRARF